MQGYHEEAVSAQIALDSTGDKFTFTPSFPIEIVRWGLIADALVDVGAGAVVKLDFRPTAGSDTGRSDGSPAAETTPTGTPRNISTSTDDIAAGKVANVELNTPASPPFQVNPGQQVVVQVTDAADTAGTAIAYIHYRRRAFQGEAGAGKLVNVIEY